jgi:citrate lyase subunit beta / citryl-CoA lyase
MSAVATAVAAPTGTPIWRSLLYVPAHVDKFVSAAHTRGADCVVLDLEDSVPDNCKAAARAAVAVAAAAIHGAGCDMAVRINAPLAQALEDIDAAVGAKASALLVPKVRDPQHVQRLDEIVGEAEQRRGIADRRTRLILIVESCDAYFQMPAIARASDRAMALVLGGEDLALEAGFEPSEETLLMPKQQLVLAAGAAGVVAFGLIASPGSFGRDLEAFRAMALRSRRFGFAGATCVHPAQVPILNEAFSPTVAELTHARRIVLASDEAQESNRGAFELDGGMVDAPIVARAHRLLARHAAIEARTPATRDSVLSGGTLV